MSAAGTIVSPHQEDAGNRTSGKKKNWWRFSAACPTASAQLSAAGTAQPGALLKRRLVATTISER